MHKRELKKPGQIMGQKKKTFKPITRGYFLIENEMFHSKAFKEIKSASTLKVMLYFLHRTYRKNNKRKKLVITNENQIDATYRQIQQATGIRHNYSITCALKELIETRGLIDRVDVGRWDTKTPSLYGLSERWRDFGTENYMKVQMKTVPEF